MEFYGSETYSRKFKLRRPAGKAWGISYVDLAKGNSMDTDDENASLENGISDVTRQWHLRQQRTLSMELSTHSSRHSVETLVTELLSTPAMDLPFAIGRSSVFNFRAAGEPLASTYWIDGVGASPKLIAQPTRRGRAHLTPNPIWISPDEERVAVTWRVDGRDEVELEIRELRNNSSLPVRIPASQDFRTALNLDLRSYYYFESGGSSLRLLNQGLTDKGSAPTVIHELNVPGTELRTVSLTCLHGGRYMVLCVRSVSHRNQFTYQILSTSPGASIRTIWKDQPYRARFSLSGERLLLLTDWDAPNQRVLVYYLNGTEFSGPYILIPESRHPIRMMNLAGDLILLVYGTTPWTTEVKAFSLTGEPVPVSGLPADGTIEDIRSVAEERYAYVEASTVCLPPSIFKLDTQTQRAHVHFRPYSRSTSFPVETTTTWFSSFDGTQVPIRISRRKDLPCTAPAPAILTAYGGFGLVDTMRYTNRSTLWLSMGGIYVHAGIRGGGELGREWHEAGMLHQKENSFRDFVTAAEWLIETGYTTTRQLAIAGGSNAGLLVGVAMTQCPELFGAVICSGPLLDMMNYHRFAGGAIGLPEYGSPDVPEDAEVIRRYSPYQRIREGVPYPAALFLSGEADTRCDPMHARKMVARLQAATSSTRPILLDYRPNKGHAGMMPLPDRINSLTNQIVFLLNAIGLRLNHNHLLEDDVAGTEPIATSTQR